MNLRFLGLVAVFTVVMLFVLVGSMDVRWVEQPNGATQMNISVEFRLPQPVARSAGERAEQVQKQGWPQLLLGTFKNAVERATERESGAQSEYTRTNNTEAPVPVDSLSPWDVESFTEQEERGTELKTQTGATVG